MEIIEAIRTRRSIRSFKPDPVPREIIEELLDTCRWAPSARNAQPWRFTVMGGKAFEIVKDALEKKGDESWDGSRYRNENPDFPRTAPHPESYIAQAKIISRTLHSAVLTEGEADEEEKRAALRIMRTRFCDAPNAILIQTDDTCPAGLHNIGIVTQSICLAALSYGLGTCIMGLTVRWPDLFRELLAIPEGMPIVTSIAIGYPEEGAALNTFTRLREPLESMTEWHGF